MNIYSSSLASFSLTDDVRPFCDATQTVQIKWWVKHYSMFKCHFKSVKLILIIIGKTSLRTIILLMIIVTRNVHIVLFITD